MLRQDFDAAGRCQKTEDRRRKTEDRRQRTRLRPALARRLQISRTEVARLKSWSFIDDPHKIRSGPGNSECGIRNAECGREKQRQSVEGGIRNAEGKNEDRVLNAELGMANSECGKKKKG